MAAVLFPVNAAIFFVIIAFWVGLHLHTQTLGDLAQETMNDPEKQARKQSVDFAVTKKRSSLSDFDKSSKRSETLSDLQDVESTDLDMHNLELEVVSIEEA